MTNEIKQNLREAWSNIDSEILRKVYWRINREANHPRIKMFVSDDEIFKMETYKEILIQRQDW
tara:strand:+ start:137 stop:325 length:189 start_codon:yes stop_codon:yes gene_type:complete